MIDEIRRKLSLLRSKPLAAKLDSPTALQKLDNLRTSSTAFYHSETGKAQLDWLDQYEASLLANAISASDPTVRLSSLDQAKGLQAFRAYLDTLIAKH